MATIVLTAVGSIVGGPIGAAVGAAIGQTIDRELLFKPKGRQGPRLTELTVQTSSYGRQVPKIFGTMRVAGCVIWATDLIETSRREGGKGRPTVTTYDYAASFAVALSARRIAGVGRIWAEGKLIRGAAGDWKSEVGGFRLYLGGEDQAPDPLIASAEGAGMAPAHRGFAYAVFEGLALAEFGNRIPSLSFEVIADGAPVTVGAIAGELAGGALTGPGPALPLDGFSAYGDGTRGAIETLAEVTGAWFAPVGGGVTMRTEATAVAVRDDSAVANRTRRPIETAARVVTISHYDPARDWQAGVQRAVRPGAGWRERAVEAPVAIAAGAAKAIAEAMLARDESERVARRVTTDIAALAIAPGDAVTIAGEGGVWRVASTAFERMAVTLDLVPIAVASPSVVASSGRARVAPDRLAGTTLIAAFETPPLDDALLTAPRLTIVAAGNAPGWRRAALLHSVDGATWIEAGGTAAPGVIGIVTTAPGAGPATLVDRANAIEVELAHEGMTLGDADAAALDRGANLAVVGGELIQFAAAAPIAPRRWRLTELLRARRGMTGPHVAGERFVMIEAASARTIAIDGAPGASVDILASGIDEAPVAAAATLRGVSLLPPAPVRLSAANDGAGGAIVRWRRRGRIGWRWRDDVDMPLGEEREAYRVRIVRADGTRRTIEVAEPMAAVLANDRTVGPVTVTVRQIGTNGVSPAATIMC